MLSATPPGGDHERMLAEFPLGRDPEGMAGKTLLGRDPERMLVLSIALGGDPGHILGETAPGWVTGDAFARDAERLGR